MSCQQLVRGGQFAGCMPTFARDAGGDQEGVLDSSGFREELRQNACDFTAAIGSRGEALLASDYELGIGECESMVSADVRRRFGMRGIETVERCGIVLAQQL